MPHGTLSNEFPGWYITFQTDVLSQLPRPGELSEDVADGWHSNRESMKKVLRDSLCPPAVAIVESQSAASSFPMSIVINVDLTPNIPSGLFLDGEGTEHRGMGEITLEKRADGKLYANGKEVVRHRVPELNGKTIQGHKLCKKLKDVQVLNACIMDALLANPQLIPDEWKTGYTYFWGTVFRDAGGRLYVECLYWNGDGWSWSCRWLDDGWSDYFPAAALAS